MRARVVTAWLCALTVSAPPALPIAPAVAAEPMTDRLLVTLDEAVRLALRDNYDARIAHLERIVQRYAVYVARDKFRPHISLTAQAGKTWATTPVVVQAPEGATVSLAPHAEILLPTGALLSADLVQRYGAPPLVAGQPLSQGLALTLTQPLLRNFGRDVNEASVSVAALTDGINKLTLKGRLMTVVSDVTYAYRACLAASRLLVIARKAVERAEELLDINHQMVAAGRMAQADLIQVESAIASRNLERLNAETRYMETQLTLLRLLALSPDAPITPVEEETATLVLPRPEEATALALRNRPEYYAALLDQQIAAKNLLLAESNRLWDLSFTAQHIRGAATGNFLASLGQALPGPQQSTFVGLVLNVPLIDVTLRQQVLAGEVALSEAGVMLESTRNAIEVEMRLPMREVRLAEQRLQLAQTARVLAEKKLDNERQKLSAGRSSNFQVLRFVDDLVVAEAGELNARISYRNAATTFALRTGRLLEDLDVAIN